MGINGITSANRMAVMQTTPTGLKDHKSKSIQNEITDVQQQIQKLSSEDTLSASEKENERRKLQKEKSSLNTELKQYQAELLRSQKREAMLAELREEQAPSKEEDAKDAIQATEASADPSSANEETENPSAEKQQAAQPGSLIAQNSDGTVLLKEVIHPAGNPSADAQAGPAGETTEAVAAAEETEPEEEADTDPVPEPRPSAREMHAMVSADTTMQQADRMGRLVAKTDDGIAVLKGEIRQDAHYGTDTERKQAELKELQKQKLQEMAFQFSMLNEAGEAAKAAADGEPLKNGTLDHTERTFQVSGLHVPQEEQAAQQGFQVSVT